MRHIEYECIIKAARLVFLFLESLFFISSWRPIFARFKFKSMEQQKKNRGIYWLIFLASSAALVLAIYTHWEWLTLILPFQTTAFVKAMDLM